MAGPDKVTLKRHRFSINAPDSLWIYQHGLKVIVEPSTHITVLNAGLAIEVMLYIFAASAGHRTRLVKRHSCLIVNIRLMNYHVATIFGAITCQKKTSGSFNAFFDEVWNQGAIEMIGEIYSEDFVAFYSPPIDFGTGLDGLRDIVIQMRNTFPDYHEEVKEVIAEGNKVVARFVVEGTHDGPLGELPPTGKSVCFEEIAIFRIENGKIVEQRGIPDVMTMFQQLGML